jgi:hypothetical protein
MILRLAASQSAGQISAEHHKWVPGTVSVNGPFTQLWLTHIDDDGNDSPPVLLEHFTPANRAANLPEFVNIDQEMMQEILISEDLRGGPPAG